MRTTATTSAPVAEQGPDVLCVGFATLDILAIRGRLEHHAGGTAANVASNLAWLGGRSALLSRLGEDPAGSFIRADLARAGVDVTHVVLDRQVATPLVVHQVDTDGGHHYLFVCPRCRRPFPRHRPPTRQMAQSAVTQLRPAVLFFDRASVASLVLAEHARATGGLVVYEPSSTGRVDLNRRATALAHVVKVSEQRLVGLNGLLQSTAPGQVQVVTAAEEGLRWRVGQGRWRDLPAFSSQRVIDGGGAGDWTTAGMLTSLLLAQRGARTHLPDLLTEVPVFEAALRFGQALACLSVEYLGARGMNVRSRRGEVLRRVADMVATPPLTRGCQPEASRHDYGDGCPACLRPLAVAS